MVLAYQLRVYAGSQLMVLVACLENFLPGLHLLSQSLEYYCCAHLHACGPQQHHAAFGGLYDDGRMLAAGERAAIAVDPQKQQGGIYVWVCSSPYRRDALRGNLEAGCYFPLPVPPSCSRAVVRREACAFPLYICAAKFVLFMSLVALCVHRGHPVE